jgi:hypothetical protein
VGAQFRRIPMSEIMHEVELIEEADERISPDDPRADTLAKP